MMPLAPRTDVVGLAGLTPLAEGVALTLIRAGANRHAAPRRRAMREDPRGSTGLLLTGTRLRFARFTAHGSCLSVRRRPPASS